MRRYCGNIVVALSAFLLALLLAEGALRWTRLSDVEGDNLPPDPRFYYVTDSATGFDHAVGFLPRPFRLVDYAEQNGHFFDVWTNELGCFDTPHVTDKIDVLLVGDSFTRGYAPFDSTWGAILERGTGTTIAKCGVTGFGTRQARLKAEKVVRKIGPPTLIVLGYFVGNDMMDDLLFPLATVSDGYRTSRGALFDEATGTARVLSDEEFATARREVLKEPLGLRRAKRFLARHSTIYNLLRNNLLIRSTLVRLGLAEVTRAPWLFRLVESHPWLEAAWADHLASLRDLRNSALAMGTQLLVVVFPAREQVYDYMRTPDPDAQWDQPNERLHAFFKAEDIRFFDLLPELRSRADQRPRRRLDPERDLYWRHDPHLNLRGNRLVGLLVSRYLLEHRFLDPVGREKRLLDIEAELVRWLH